MSDGNREDACKAPTDEKREEGSKGLSCFSPCCDSRMNYGLGRKQENINLTLILNSDFAPRHHSLGNCHSCSSFQTNRSIVETHLVYFILIFKNKAFQKPVGFQNPDCAAGRPQPGSFFQAFARRGSGAAIWRKKSAHLMKIKKVLHF